MNVTYSESIKLRRPSLTPSEVGRILNRLRDKKSGTGFTRALPQGLRVMTPKALPFHGKAGRVLNSALLKSDFEPVIKLADVFWTYTPTTYDLELKSPAAVYHCVDLYSTIKGINPKVVRDMERRLADRGVVAVGSSMPVVDHLKEQGFSQVEFWPNVADVEVFKKASDPEINERSGVIFAGHLTADKLNVDAMLDIAKLCKTRGEKFTLVGPLNVGSGDFRSVMSKLVALGATYVGSLPLEQVAQECKKHLVGIIPYSENDYNFGVSPLKLYEYMAAGLSVVSTGLPSIQMVQSEYSDDLVISAPKDFGDAVSNQLNAQLVASDIDRRLKIAEDNSWSKRHFEIKSLLEELGVF
jgi:glycosyltransferase involved in cell wall biosynthesis